MLINRAAGVGASVFAEAVPRQCNRLKHQYRKVLFPLVLALIDRSNAGAGSYFLFAGHSFSRKSSGNGFDHGNAHKGAGKGTSEACRYRTTIYGEQDRRAGFPHPMRATWRVCATLSARAWSRFCGRNYHRDFRAEVILLRMSTSMTAAAMRRSATAIFAFALSKAFKVIRFLHLPRAPAGINAEVTGRLTESLSGVRVVKGLSRRRHAKKKYLALALQRLLGQRTPNAYGNLCS